MSYLLPGLWHFAAAMAFAAAFGVIQGGDLAFWLRHAEFTLPLLLASSAFFFVPDAWAKKGPLKFLHYPLPDWDVLFLGPASHRNWLTHSALLPMLGVYLFVKRPDLTLFHPVISVAVGLCVGIASHLFWDCVGSKRHQIVVIPYWFTLQEATSRLYLLCGAVVSLGVAFAFANWGQLKL